MADDSRVAIWVGAIGSLLAGVAAVAALMVVRERGPETLASPNQPISTLRTEPQNGSEQVPAPTTTQGRSEPPNEPSTSQDQQAASLPAPVASWRTAPSEIANAAIGNPVQQLNQLESILRERLAGTGVGVMRVSEYHILLNLPAGLTFDHNRDHVGSPFVPTLREVAGVLGDYPQVRVDVVGHTSSIGTDDYNQQLSERRAMNVSSELIRGGVRREQLIASGFGETRPITDNSTDSNRHRNDRVEIMISTQ